LQCEITKSWRRTRYKGVMQLNYCHELDKTWSKIDLSALSQATDLDKACSHGGVDAR
jgi:hypothetical protein